MPANRSQVACAAAVSASTGATRSRHPALDALGFLSVMAAPPTAEKDDEDELAVAVTGRQGGRVLPRPRPRIWWTPVGRSAKVCSCAPLITGSPLRSPRR